MYLIILSSTKRQGTNPNPVPAFDRFCGLYPSLIRSMQRERCFPKKCDIIFVTAHGIVKGDERILGFDTPMTPELALSLRDRNLERMRDLLGSKKYDEIYVNIGQSYQRSIEGFEAFTKANVTYAKGVLGQKSAHMKQWILGHVQG